GENLIPFATVFSDAGASGSGGLGAVLGSKNIKAIVALGSQRPVAANPERLKELVRKFNVLRPGGPVEMPWMVPGITRNGACFGCGTGCSRQVYNGEDGRIYKSLCQSSSFYMEALPDGLVDSVRTKMLASRLSDGYGLDTAVLSPVLGWLEYCHRTGLLTDKETGLNLSDIGTESFIRDFMRKVTEREGFGDVLARGVIAAAAVVGPEAGEVLGRFVATANAEKRDYDPRITMTTALLYATEPRRPIQQLHEIAMPLMGWLAWAQGDTKSPLNSKALREAAARMWGSELAADFSTYEGKSLAAKMLQDRVYAKESLVVCDLKWTMTLAMRNGSGPDGPVTESQVYSAITGNEIGEEELYRFGERNFNVQRAVLLRQGWPGRDGDRVLDYMHTEPIEKNSTFFNGEVLLPGRDGEVISRAGEVLDRDRFEDMKTEYYELRGWNPETGYPTREKLEELQLADVAADLAERGLLG
ncbi:MAG: hypothetical protein MUO19_00605, partial [Dehalococcoidales bacterium]|nr:hypothetical protein [Dehalococcoidales bacterium]